MATPRRPSRLPLWKSYPSHWNQGGIEVFVEALGALLKNLKGEEGAVRAEPQVIGTRGGDLLNMLGLVPTHPATRYLFQLPPRVGVTLDPPEAVRAIITKLKPDSLPARIALLGTSFSKASRMSRRLAAEFDQLVLEGVANGILALKILEKWASAHIDAEVKQTVILELPAYQAVLLHDMSPTLMKSLSAFFGPTDGSRMEVWAGMVRKTTVGQLREQPQVWPRGSILSSGDSALYVEIDVDSPAPAQWHILVGETPFPTVLATGRQRVVLPVLEADEIIGSLQIECGEELPDDLPVTIRVLSDELVDGTQPVKFEKLNGSTWRTVLAGVPVDRDAFVDLTWSGDNNAMTVVMQGRDRDGDLLERELHFTESEAKRARLGLYPFAGGEVAEIQVHADGASGFGGFLGRADYSPAR